MDNKLHFHDQNVDFVDYFLSLGGGSSERLVFQKHSTHEEFFQTENFVIQGPAEIAILENPREDSP